MGKDLTLLYRTQTKGPTHHLFNTTTIPIHPTTTTQPTQALDDPLEEMEKLAAASGVKGCAYCGGLGHRIADCPKLKSEAKEKSRPTKDHFGSGGFGGEM